MSRLRRHKGLRRACFITCVTFERQPILVDNSDLFWKAIQKTQAKSAFELLAHVVLPEHFHLLLEPLEKDFPAIMQRLKMSFGAFYRQRHGMSSGRVWQHRYWDHVIRDEVDLNRHINYIHYNPVKHGLVSDPAQWRDSSFRRYR